METINKLLKKQAPKINRKAAAAAARGENGEDESQKPSSTLIRWVNTKDGSKVSVPGEMVGGPAGNLFGPATGLASGGKLIEEVA